MHNLIKEIPSLLWEKDTPLIKKILYSLLLAFVLFGFYSIGLLLLGPGELEIELDIPGNDMILQVFGYGGKSRGQTLRTKKIYRGKSAHIFTFYSGIRVIRLDPGFKDNVQLNISKLKFSQGFTIYEMPFSDNKAADIITEKRFHQLKYLGNGNFLTIGDDPYFYFRLKDTPRKNTILFHLIFLIPVFTLLVFFFPQLLFLLKVLSANRLFHDYPFLIYAFMVILLGWGFEIFNFTFTHDDEMWYVLTTQNIIDGWLFQERWGMALITFLTGNPTVPVIPLVITLFCYFLSFGILFYSPNGREKYYVFPIYAVFPMLFQSFSFTSLNPGIGVAFLFSALAVYLTNKNSIICFIFAILFTVFLFGSYAVLILYIAIAGVYCWLYRGIRHAFYCRFKYIRYIACKYLILFVSSFLLHKLLTYIYYFVFNIRSGNFITENYISKITHFYIWVNCILNKIWQFYSGSNQLFPKAIIFHFFTVSFALLIIIVGFSLLCKNKKNNYKILLFLGVVFLFFAPFLPDVLHQYAAIPFRVITLLFPLGLSSIFYLALVLSKPYHNIRTIFIFLLVFISIQYLWNLNQNTYLNYQQNKRDFAVLSKLQNRIDSVPEFALKAACEADIPVWIIGNNPHEQLMYRHQVKHYPNWQSESIGISCFSEPRRVVAMLNIYHYPYYTTAAASSDKISFVETMPMWPLNGSVAFYRDCLIIKLSDHLPSDSKALNRKLRYRNPFPINGAEELICTRPDPARLLHTYRFDELDDSKVTEKGSDMLIKINKKGRLISFPAHKYNVPYVILDITADFDEDGVLHLWSDRNTQYMQFAFKAGVNHLKVRCPSYFLDKIFRITFGEDKVKRVLLKEIKVYEDAQYTDNLLRLNPGLNQQKLMEVLHD